MSKLMLCQHCIDGFLFEGKIKSYDVFHIWGSTFTHSLTVGALITRHRLSGNALAGQLFLTVTVFDFDAMTARLWTDWPLKPTAFDQALQVVADPL